VERNAQPPEAGLLEVCRAPASEVDQDAQPPLKPTSGVERLDGMLHHRDCRSREAIPKIRLSADSTPCCRRLQKHRTRNRIADFVVMSASARACRFS
jgi:hypothetical protein